MAAEATTGKQVATIVTQTRIRPGRHAQFSSWQERMSAVVAAAPGYVSQEVIPADPPIQEDWVIIQRFRSRTDAQAWLASDDRAQMIKDVKPLVEGDDAISVVDNAPAQAQQGSTAVIRTTVVPGQEARFRAWSAEVGTVQSTMPGYVGSALQEPIPGVQEQWVTLLAFDTAGHLQAWLGSERRAALLRKARAMMTGTETRLVESGFEGWFDFARPGGQTAPPAWKFNYLILVGLYPIVMLEILFLDNKLAWMNLALGNLISNIISVAILGWPVVAALSKLMSWWINPGPDASRYTDLKGALIIIAVLAILVTIFFLVVNYVGFDTKVFRI